MSNNNTISSRTYTERNIEEWFVIIIKKRDQKSDFVIQFIIKKSARNECNNFAKQETNDLQQLLTIEKEISNEDVD